MAVDTLSPAFLNGVNVMKPVRGLLILAAALALPSGLHAQEASPSDNGVFVTQIGEGNSSTIIQSNSSSRALLRQGNSEKPGARNQASIDQREEGVHSAEVIQNGDDNTASVSQAGDGATQLALIQNGLENTAQIEQTQFGTSITSAEIGQNGDRNELSLTQSGNENRALLSQAGNDNQMTVTQLGTGNQLSWRQVGDGLSDLDITQNGTQQAMEITQTMMPLPSSGS